MTRITTAAGVKAPAALNGNKKHLDYFPESAERLIRDFIAKQTNPVCRGTLGSLAMFTDARLRRRLPILLLIGRGARRA